MGLQYRLFLFPSFLGKNNSRLVSEGDLVRIVSMSTERNTFGRIFISRLEGLANNHAAL